MATWEKPAHCEGWWREHRQTSRLWSICCTNTKPSGKEDEQTFARRARLTRDAPGCAKQGRTIGWQGPPPASPRPREREAGSGLGAWRQPGLRQLLKNAQGPRYLLRGPLAAKNTMASASMRLS